jgi:putative heme iron utilization protein
MNADHSEACQLYATRLLNLPDGAWRCVGVSPEGVELQWGGAAAWLPFPQRVTDPGRLRMLLKELADKARAISA